MSSLVVLLDFGSQYTQVIARRIRECRVFSRILPFDTRARALAEMAPRGIILSGGPASVYGRGAPRCDPGIWELGVPVLGICYGMHMMAHQLGGRVRPGERREYGHAVIDIAGDPALFRGMGRRQRVWMSHGDSVTRVPRGFSVQATGPGSPFAAIGDERRRFYGLQFHPEVHHTPHGGRILSNFVHRVCGAPRDWTMKSFIRDAVRDIRATVGAERVVLGLSGGVDSSVAAALIHRAIGEQLTCVLVDNGLLRMGEADSVQRVFGRNMRMKLVCADAGRVFLSRLRGVSDPERKRKIIGRTFVEVFERVARRTGRARFLAQGTTYPDVIESVPISGSPSALIKSHHNVGGLPRRMKLTLLEPLHQLFKDEVREVGTRLGLPDEMVWRQPFPGPGLALRILGPVSAARVRMVQEADRIVIDEMKRAGVYYKVWQTFAVLLPVRTVGVMGDARTYDHVVAIRAVDSVDGMTADWVRLDYDLLQRLSNRIINEVKGVNRVCLDISSKPPSTIEWE